jgi:hypothetical protein
LAKAKVIERKYQTLDEAAIIETITQLRNRVVERFPERGLAQSAGFLVDLAAATAVEVARLRRPNRLVQFLVFAVLALGLAAVVWVADLMPELRFTAMTLSDFTQALEAAFNLVILIGLSIVFLLGLEARVNRRTALEGLYRLRAIAHVIDMHQLTKDPVSILGRERTDSSPARDLNRDQLLRYLDYCTEMLSMIGKLAALYVQHLPDPVVISSANDIEVLTTNLSRKIWQKILVVKDEPVRAGGD